MPLDSILLEFLACPQCKAKVEPVESGEALFCRRCHVTFPVRNGIPIMLLRHSVEFHSGRKPKKERAEGGHLFRVAGGPKSGTTFFLEPGTCRLLAREEEGSPAGETIDLSIDHHTQSLITTYIAKQFPQSKGEAFFHRSHDVLIADAGLSAPHAIFFCDQSGVVALLDLVSRSGTFVGGREVESCLLQPGDVVECGETVVRYEGVTT